MVYTTDPLPEDLEVTGHPVATVYLSANATDTTLFVYLEDIHTRRAGALCDGR